MKPIHLAIDFVTEYKKNLFDGNHYKREYVITKCISKFPEYEVDRYTAKSDEVTCKRCLKKME